MHAEGGTLNTIALKKWSTSWTQSLQLYLLWEGQKVQREKVLKDLQEESQCHRRNEKPGNFIEKPGNFESIGRGWIKFKVVMV